MARRKAENGQELLDTGSSAAEELKMEATVSEEGQLTTETSEDDLASEQKKETWYRVSTKNPVTKKMGTIQFVDGEALVPSSERWMLIWFKEHGYRIEEATIPTSGQVVNG